MSNNPTPEITEKTCCSCKQSLPIASFYRSRSRPDGWHNQCRTCSTAAARRYERTPKGRERVYQRAKRRRTLASDHVNAHKASHGCMFCGERTPVCLDFHHIDRESKTMTVSRTVNERKSLSLAEAEMAKCLVICANCHRKVHAGLLVSPVD